MSRLFRVGIIGAGRIAATFDMPSGPEIRTHMKAILADRRFVVTHIGDQDTQTALDVAKRFGIRAEIVVPDAVAVADVDALCIASPDGTHMNYAKRAVSGPARVVLIEKPLEGTIEERKFVAEELAERGATLAAHHQRRWIPGVSGWIEEARRGVFGNPLSGTIHYTRGFRHNGIHALDLVAAFLGTQVESVIRIADNIVDYSNDDQTRSLLVTMRVGELRVPLTMYGVDGRVQTVFSISLRFEHAGIFIFDEMGVRAELHKPVPLNVSGYAPELRPVSRFVDNPPRLLAEVWRNIADHLECGEPIVCAGSEALAAYELADAILARCST